MIWKTLILLAVASVVLAARIKKHSANYEFHVKHDYDYGHHKKIEHMHVKENDEHFKDENPNEEKKEQGEQEKEDEKQEEQENNNEEKLNEVPEQTENQEELSNIETQESENQEENEFPSYEFLYKVEDRHTHDLKGQHEKKHGDEVMGTYWLIQPDGHKRTVKYHANKHDGFHANVDYTKHEEQDDAQNNSEQQDNDGGHGVTSKSQYFITIRHGFKKPIPIKEEQQEEQENQEESAENIPIYVI